MRSPKSLVPLILIGLLLSSFPSAKAIEGGNLAISENVVSFVLRNSFTGTLSRPTCSGGMISSRIVVTAKHCVEGFNSKITWLINKNWEVTYPGVDIESKDLITARIVNIIARPGEFSTQDDIALIVIDRDFPVPTNLKVANVEDMIRLRKLEASSLTYGYGGTATSNLQTYLPFKIENKLIQDFPHRSYGQGVFAIKYVSSTAYVCGGDSGGPNFVLSGEFSYYIGPTGFATRPGCAKGLEGNFYSGGTAIAYNSDLFDEAELLVEKMKTDELRAAAELTAKQEAEARAAAELKAKQEAEAKAIADAAAQKAIEDDFNAVTSSYQKLLLRIYDLKIKFPRVSNLLGIEEKLLRLPIILGGDLSTAKYNIQSVNASLDTSEKVWEKTQKTTISCVKGKTTKKVTAIKPKCPSGYKVKK